MAGLLRKPTAEELDDRRRIKAMGLSYERLVDYAAKMEKVAKLNEEACEALESDFRDVLDKVNRAIEKKQLDHLANIRNTLAPALLDALKKQRKRESAERARWAANARHSQPGGSREKQQKVRELWARGSYRTKDDCARAASEGSLGISYTAARKALRNAPSPRP